MDYQNRDRRVGLVLRQLDQNTKRTLDQLERTKGRVVYNILEIKDVLTQTGRNKLDDKAFVTKYVSDKEFRLDCLEEMIEVLTPAGFIKESSKIMDTMGAIASAKAQMVESEHPNMSREERRRIYNEEMGLRTTSSPTTKSEVKSLQDIVLGKLATPEEFKEKLFNTEFVIRNEEGKEVFKFKIGELSGLNWEVEQWYGMGYYGITTKELFDGFVKKYEFRYNKIMNAKFIGDITNSLEEIYNMFYGISVWHEKELQKKGKNWISEGLIKSRYNSNIYYNPYTIPGAIAIALEQHVRAKKAQAWVVGTGAILSLISGVGEIAGIVAGVGAGGTVMTSLAALGAGTQLAGSFIDGKFTVSEGVTATLNVSSLGMGGVCSAGANLGKIGATLRVGTAIGSVVGDSYSYASSTKDIITSSLLNHAELQRQLSQSYDKNINTVIKKEIYTAPASTNVIKTSHAAPTAQDINYPTPTTLSSPSQTNLYK